MPRTPGKGHEALRRGRWSNSDSEYFLTLCTNQRQAGLTAPSLLAVVLGQLYKLEAEQIGTYAPRRSCPITSIF
ncbi:MAG: hypothetical protein QM715_13810 [Nibricoccus sp.]